MKLAIQGHPIRGKEVIELLEMLGGVNPFLNNGYVIGNKESNCYYISEDTETKYISWGYIGPEEINEYIIFTLEEFEQKFPYKVGDKVIAYVENCIAQFTIQDMRWNPKLNKVEYKICSSWCDTNLMQPYKEETMEEINIDKIGFNGDKARLIFPDGYEFKVEGNEVFVIKKKFKYPKTYEECCKIKQSDPNFYIDTHLYSNKLGILYKLLICRDAYWKIAGEEIGLNKPWEPDYTNPDIDLYVIINVHNNIEKAKYGYGFQNCVLSFPTEEMRDAFYENFKDLIEQCKELV